MINKRYRLIACKSGNEIWVWFMWFILIQGFIITFSYMTGKFSERLYYKPILDAVNKQYKSGCEEPLEIGPIPKYNQYGVRVN